MPDARCFCKNGCICSLDSFIFLTLVGLYSIKCVRVIMRGGSQGNSCHHRMSHWKSPYFYALALLALVKSIPSEFPQGKRHLSVIKKKALILDICYSWLFQQSWSFYFLFSLPFTFTLLQTCFCLLKVDFSASISAFFSISAQTQHTCTNPCAQPQEFILRRASVPKESDNPSLHSTCPVWRTVNTPHFYTVQVI